MSRFLVVVGQGYVGLPVAMRAVEVGHRVVGVDLNERRVADLCAGNSYVDDVPSESLRAALDTGRYQATSSYQPCADFEVAVITVPTPLREGVPDLSYIERACESLAEYLRSGATVVLESTTYPGTTQELVVPLLEEGSGLRCGTDFFVGYSPERIDPGNTDWDFVRTPKVVSGVDDASLKRVQEFYAVLVDTTVAVSGPREAELAKLIENTFRHVNIALVNELAVFANQMGIDIWEAIDAASTKPFGFMRFTPGPGVGGHCLPVDPSYLSWQVRQRLGRSFRFVELANDVNDHMPDHVVQRAVEVLNAASKPVRGSSVLLLGLAYKANTGDIREAPSLRVIDLLAGMGATVRAVDSHVRQHDVPDSVELVQLDGGQLAAADLTILLTAHASVDLADVAQSATPVLDTRGLLRGRNVVRL